jgi:hypothetical protein
LLLLLGNNAEYLVQLKLLRPAIEQQLSGIKLYLCCRDSLYYLLDDSPNTLPESELYHFKNRFAYIRELTIKQKHPVLEFMEESELTIPQLGIGVFKKGLALICPEGLLPTKSLTAAQVNKLKDLVVKEGYSPLVIGSDIHAVLPLSLRPKGKEKLSYLQEASYVVGVENEYLFLAGSLGKDTGLVPTGLGTELYKKMFPQNKVLKHIYF